ncbi:MAG: DNA integrity scanning protein DisA nucleotide-binding domain protein [Clostridia bacterium]|nr:DNA integrity scanning protein DisA nucleotide-binding domain protein [Clostridia bacterium]
MTTGLLASWSEIQKGTTAFFESFKGWGIVEVLVEIFMIFFLIFFVSKILRDNDATKLMIVYWVALGLGGVLHLIATDIMSKDIFFIYILLVSAIMLIMFSTEIKKIFWDVQKTKQTASERAAGGNTEIRTQADTERCIEAIHRALQDMSKNKVGALIVLSKGNVPRNVLQSGTAIDAEVSSQLIGGVFFPNSPLHDGAMIIKGYKIQAAGCFLPLTQKMSYPKEFGSRHRAAIGITEVSNVIAIVVSEETGIISIVKQGKVTRYSDDDNIKVTRYADYDNIMDALRDYYLNELPSTDKKRNGGNR